MRKTLLTGANGFVGSAVLKCLTAEGLPGTGTGRREAASPPGLVIVGELGPETAWSDVLPGHQVVVHTAARVHVMQDSAVDPLAEFRRVNVEGTLNLARQAAAAGVKRFIFISSIKVNGEGTSLGKAYTPDDEPQPADAYGVSKKE